MYRQIIFILFTVIAIVSCNTSTETNSTQQKINGLKTKETQIKENTDSENKATNDKVALQNEDSEGPPFKDKCLCTFKEFGYYKINKDNFNIYYSGKHWNPKYYSCMWTWGEILSNEYPSNYKVNVLTMHLLDLDNFIIPTNLTEYGNDTIKKYVIAVYRQYLKKGKGVCTFDPYKTGKYPKPEKWIE
jgi:hypothetical protein